MSAHTAVAALERAHARAARPAEVIRSVLGKYKPELHPEALHPMTRPSFGVPLFHVDARTQTVQVWTVRPALFERRPEAMFVSAFPVELLGRSDREIATWTREQVAAYRATLVPGLEKADEAIAKLEAQLAAARQERERLMSASQLR